MGECERSLSWPFNPLKHFQAPILKCSFGSSLGWLVLYPRPWNMYLHTASCLFFFNIRIREGHTAPSALTSGELSCTHRVEKDARDGHPLSQSSVCGPGRACAADLCLATPLPRSLGSTWQFYTSWD